MINVTKIVGIVEIVEILRVARKLNKFKNKTKYNKKSNTMARKKRFLGTDNGDDDPLASIPNLTDAMLVLAVGFLIFAVMSMNMQSVIFSDDTPEQKQKLADAIKQTVSVEEGQDYNGTVDVDSGESGGMENMGTVYKDPTTGKLIMIPPTNTST